MNNNRVTQEQIDQLLDSAETQEHTFWDKELFVSYRLSFGFTVTGRGACVDPANFDLEIGRKVARQHAADQLWQLEGYRLQLELATAPMVAVMPPLPDDPGWLTKLQGDVPAGSPFYGGTAESAEFVEDPGGVLAGGALADAGFIEEAPSAIADDPVDSNR